MLFKITKYKANDFLFFQKLVGHTVGKTTLEQKLEFLFDLFSDFNPEMKQDNCIMFCKLFQGKPPDKYPINEENFLSHFML